jgi:hypothetical protein
MRFARNDNFLASHFRSASSDGGRSQYQNQTTRHRVQRYPVRPNGPNHRPVSGLRPAPISESSPRILPTCGDHQLIFPPGA